MLGYLTSAKWACVQNKGGTNAKAEVTQKTQTGERQDTTLIVYQAEWKNEELDVIVKELCEPQQNDSIFVDLWFSEPMYPESIVVELVGEDPMPMFPVVELGWETEVFGDDHWRGCIPIVVWESVRNTLKGERRLRILAWDLAGAMLDTDPSTYVHIDTTTSEWVEIESAATGNDDWSTVWVANDFWHGTVTVTQEDISKMYGDLRLMISGTVDMAGDTLDWDLDTPGAQAYEYPLHMPGFVASSNDENAGVERNTTSVGESTWPMGWGTIDVMGRGFNTDATDPLSVQSMTIDIERLFAPMTVISGAGMTQSERDFSYEWDTASDLDFVDCEYEVTLKAFDGTSQQILSDMERGRHVNAKSLKSASFLNASMTGVKFGTQKLKGVKFSNLNWVSEKYG